MTSRAYQAYNQNHTAVLAPEKLIEMLYEGILRFTSLAKRSIKNDNIEDRAKYSNKSTDIFIELINSLEKRDGTITAYLDGLYHHQITLLTTANTNNCTKELDTVLHVTKTLIEAWREETAVEQPAEPAVA